MAYSHHLRRRRTLPLAPWRAAVADCRTLLARLRADGLPLAETDDDPVSPPLLTDAEIVFNGVGDDGYDTFLVERRYKPFTASYDSLSYTQKPEGGLYFTFTKTARKPYDLAVCGCLVVLAHHLGDAVQVTSDGDDDKENWPRARELCQELFGYGWDFTAARAPVRLTAAGLLPWDGPARRCEDYGYSVRKLATGLLVRVSRRNWPKPGLEYVGRPFGARAPLTPDGYAWQPGGRVAVRDPHHPYGLPLWFADSTAEARAEATKIYLWETLHRLPGAGEFLPGALKAHPDLLPLRAWADWLGDRQTDREHVLAWRTIDRVLPAVPKPRKPRMVPCPA